MITTIDFDFLLFIYVFSVNTLLYLTNLTKVIKRKRCKKRHGKNSFLLLIFYRLVSPVKHYFDLKFS